MMRDWLWFLPETMIILIAFVSFVSSSLLLRLLFKRNSRNNFTSLIKTIATFQILNDFGYFFLVPGMTNEPCLYLANCLFVFSFTATMIWTNFLSLFTLCLIYRRKPIDVSSYYYYCLATALIPAIAFVLYEILFCAPNWDFAGYSYWRISLILLNSLLCLLSSKRVANFFSSNLFHSNQLSEEMNHVLANKLNSSLVLASRLKYYPLCQIITRLPVIYFQVSFPSEKLNFSTSQSSLEFKNTYALSIAVAASAGLGYFLIYLKIQPHAYTQLKRMFAESVSHFLSCLQLLLCLSHRVDERIGSKHLSCMHWLRFFCLDLSLSRVSPDPSVKQDPSHHHPPGPLGVSAAVSCDPSHLASSPGQSNLTSTHKRSAAVGVSDIGLLDEEELFALIGDLDDMTSPNSDPM